MSNAQGGGGPNRIYYMLVGALIVAVIGIGYLLYQEKSSEDEVEIKLKVPGIELKAE